MLRDDAIRQGFMKPDKNDIKRMKLSPKELAELNKLRKQLEKGKGEK